MSIPHFVLAGLSPRPSITVPVDTTVAELQLRLLQIRTQLQTAIAVAPRNTSTKVMTAVRTALALAQ